MLDTISNSITTTMLKTTLILASRVLIASAEKIDALELQLRVWRATGPEVLVAQEKVAAIKAELKAAKAAVLEAKRQVWRANRAAKAEAKAAAKTAKAEVAASGESIVGDLAAI